MGQICSCCCKASQAYLLYFHHRQSGGPYIYMTKLEIQMIGLKHVSSRPNIHWLECNFAGSEKFLINNLCKCLVLVHATSMCSSVPKAPHQTHQERFSSEHMAEMIFGVAKICDRILKLTSLNFDILQTTSSFWALFKMYEKKKKLFLDTFWLFWIF